MEGKFLHIRNTRTFFIERGNGMPLVFIHGNTGSSRWFERSMDVPRCRTIALDMPNFGRSGPLLAEPDIDFYADFVMSFIGTLDLERPVVVGHSLGGAISISLAVRYSKLLRALVLVDSSSPSGLVTQAERYALVEGWRTNRDSLSEALFSVMPTLKDRDFFNSLVDDAMLMAPLAWIGNARALNVFDYTRRCGGFTGPVLVVWGRKDAIITESMARDTVHAFPNARLKILDNVGHSPMVEDPSGFLNILSSFVSEIEKESA
jgi:branched-chain amino acid transport system permease protein